MSQSVSVTSITGGISCTYYVTSGPGWIRLQRTSIPTGLSSPTYSRPQIFYSGQSTALSNLSAFGETFDGYFYVQVANYRIEEKIYSSGAWRTLILPSNYYPMEPLTAPYTPAISSIILGSGQLTINYYSNGDGGSTITNYQYTLNSGNTAVNMGTTNPFTITGLVTGTTYNVQIRAQNSIGTSGWSSIGVIGSPGTVPGAPIIIGLSSGPGYIELTHQIPDNGGLAITTYQYRLNSGNAVNFMGVFYQHVVFGNYYKYRITGLTNGKSYDVQIRAVNSAGPGDWGVVWNRIPYTLPEAPVINIIVSQDSKVVVYYSPPPNSGNSITSYDYDVNMNSSFFSFSSIVNPFIITGLTIGTSHALRLRARNNIGVGEWSNSVIITPIAVPSAPVINSSSSGDSQLTINYTAPSDGGSAITSYQYTLNGGSTVTSFSSIVNPFIITGLTNGTSYNVQLRALNEAGTGAWSNSTTNTPYEIPGKPIINSIVPGFKEILISFKSPTSLITNYKYSIDNGTNYISCSPPTSESPINVLGLSDNTSYQVKIRAFNNSIAGIESDMFEVKTNSSFSVENTIFPLESLSTKCDGSYATFRTSSSYTGPTLKIRRSNDNLEQDFYADLYGNFGTSLNATGIRLESWLYTPNENTIIKARYIKFQYGNSNNGNGRYMNLSEIKVYSSKNGSNIINSGMIATASSYASEDYSPSKIIDGNENTIWHNILSEYSWVMVDLGSDTPIYKVELINRKDCCTGRAAGLFMELRKNDDSVIFTSNLITAKNGTQTYQEYPLNNGYLFYTFWPSINKSAYGSDSLPFPTTPTNYKSMGYLIPYVTTWYDQSGQGKHATQTNQSLQPIFDFVNKRMDFASRIGSYFDLPNETVPRNTPYTITLKHGNINYLHGSLLGTGNEATGQMNNIRRSPTGYYNYWYSNDFGGNDNTYNQENIVTYQFDGTYSSLYVNGTPQGVSSNRSGWNGQSGNERIASNALEEHMNGEMYFLYIFKKSLSQNDRRIIERGMPVSVKTKSISCSQLKSTLGLTSNISFSKLLKYNGNISNSRISLSNFDGFIFSNGLFFKSYINQSHSNIPSFFANSNNTPNNTGVSSNLNDIYSATGGLPCSNAELLGNGSFQNGNHITQFSSSDSFGSYSIISLPNPGESPYVLRQGGNTEYQMNWTTEVQPNTTYILSGWYSKSNDFNGNSSMFHARAHSTSQNHIYTEFELYNIIETRIINGLTWNYCYATITTPSDYNNTFHWYLGYISYPTVGNQYYTKLSLRKLLDASEWYGLFYAPLSGTYTFNLNSNNLSYLWIGDEALSGFSDSNALIKSTTTPSQQATKTLTSGQYYPLRIQRFNGSTINFSFTFSLPNGTLVQNGTGYFFSNASHSSTNIISNTNLLSHYQFDKGDVSDAKLANWASGVRVFDATLYNGAYLNNSVYKVGSTSLFLDQNSYQYVQLPNFTSTTNGLSFSFWYRSNGTRNFGRIFDFGNGNTYNNNILVSTNANDENKLMFSCFYNSIGETFYISDINYNDNQWRHITWTLTYAIDGNRTSTWKIYINGSLKENTTGKYYPRTNITLNNCYIGKSGTSNTDYYYNGYIDDFRIYNRVLNDAEAGKLASSDTITYIMKNENNTISTQIQGTVISNPAPSGYSLYTSNPWLPNGYYWIKSPSMPNPLQMYVDIKYGGFDYYRISGGTSVLDINTTHSGTSLGLELMIPRSQDHWRSIYNYIYNVLKSDYTTILKYVPIYKTSSGGNYTSYAMFHTKYGNNGSYNGAPDWRTKDEGLWHLRNIPYGEPNGDYTLNQFLGIWSEPETSYGAPTFNDITSGYYTGTEYIVSTNHTGSLNVNTIYHINIYYDGTSYDRSAPSASYIKNTTGTNTNGIYWINLPTVGPTQVYCIMDSDVNGGGWMMAMKATTGTTFNYDSNYWTTANTLNPSDNTRNNADAKFNTMNYFQSKDILALWPDIPSNYNSGTGGNLNLSSSYNNWCWLKNNYNSGTRQTLINFFSTASNLSFGTAKGVERGTAFSSQGGNSFYGANFVQSGRPTVRWGFGWNNENDWASNDVSGGIGMSHYGVLYSSGDYIGCCQDQTGINRSARVEVYIR